MTGIDVRYVGNGVMRTGAGTEFGLSDSYAILPRELVEPLSLAELRSAAKKMWDRDLHLLELWLADVPVAGFDPETVRFRDISDVRLTAYEELAVVIPTGHLVDDGAEAWNWVSDVLQPLLRRRGARLESVGVDIADSSDQTIVATIAPPWRGKTAADAIKIGEEALALIRAMDGQGLDLATSADLVRTGNASVLVDQAEGPWLDGKRAPYQFSTERQKLEFAKDIASFANSPTGGLILIGARTVPTADGDIISAVHDIDLTLVSVPQMRAIARDRIFPPIEGLEVGRVDHGGVRGVVYILVPPQPASRTPFLVRGTHIEGGIRTAFFGVPERDGEDIRWSEISTLHGLLQAGKLANAIAESADHNQAEAPVPSANANQRTQSRDASVRENS